MSEEQLEGNERTPSARVHRFGHRLQENVVNYIVLGIVLIAFIPVLKPILGLNLTLFAAVLLLAGPRVNQAAYESQSPYRRYKDLAGKNRVLSKPEFTARFEQKVADLPE